MKLNKHKLNKNDDRCPICGKVIYIGKIDKACTDPECEMGQGELAYIKRYFEIAKQRISKALNKSKQITLWRR